MMSAKSNHYLLPAPKIAGLLPAVCPKPEPDDDPTPTAPILAPVCEGWANAHWGLPELLQDTPATHYVIARKVCAHCYCAFQKSMGITKQREADAKNTRTLTYTKFADAA